MRKIKIINFTISNSRGGVTSYNLNNFEHINRERFDMDFVTMCKEPLDYENQLTEAGARVFHLSVFAEQNESVFEKEVSEILRLGYDIAHLHTSWWRGFYIERIAKQLHIPKVIVHSHSTGTHNEGNLSQTEAVALHYRIREMLQPDIATDYWACSQSAADWLYGNKIPDNKIVLMPNSIETEKFIYCEETRRKYRAALNLDGIVLGLTARFEKVKNHEFLIGVFEELLKCDDSYKLLLIGTGKLEEHIKELVRTKGLEKNVRFMGKRNDVNCLLQAIDLFVMPSRYEGIPISLIEAQAAGLPVICSDQITREADITGNVKFLELDSSKWVDAIFHCPGIGTRKNMQKTVEAAGYDNCEAIKKLEKMYAAGITV